MYMIDARIRSARVIGTTISALPAVFTSALAAVVMMAIPIVLASCGEKKIEWNEYLVNEALKSANPGYNGEAQMQIMGGEVIALGLDGTGVTDLTPLTKMGIRRLDLKLLDVSDLGPLKGLSLTELYLEGTGVTDLTPLKGMPITTLYLNVTEVSDIGPLAGMPLETLSLFQTKVKDLKPLSGMPLKMLWLNATPVSDISPLAGLPLKSLTLYRTQVNDLSPLAGSGIERLNIAETPVRDLTPLAGLGLTRLIFTPELIKKGLEIPKNMETIYEIGTTFETMMPPKEFWERYDLLLDKGEAGEKGHR